VLDLIFIDVDVVFLCELLDGVADGGLLQARIKRVHRINETCPLLELLANILCRADEVPIASDERFEILFCDVGS
jgi:hypothetical protein